MLDSAGRLEYVIQAAECGWDSELASSNWDPVSGRGELGRGGGARHYDEAHVQTLFEVCDLCCLVSRSWLPNLNGIFK